MSRILLVNPPVYDFSAYDFWLKPYGLLRVGGTLRDKADLSLFDFLDRFHAAAPQAEHLRSDEWGRGEFHSEIVAKPEVLEEVPRRFRRFGIPRERFVEFLRGGPGFDFALVETSMTWWYPGVREVIETLRARSPGTRIVLGGFYATAMPDHARSLGADLVVEGRDLSPLLPFLGLEGDLAQPALYEGYAELHSAAMKLTDGCPLRCTYCAVPRFYPGFETRPTGEVLAELDLILSRGCTNVAFYDDALLHRPEDSLVPFLDEVLRRDLRVSFHTPNALHVKLLTRELAELMVRGGFKTFYLGFESASADWQRETGGKASAEDFARAVENLRAAGAEAAGITAYIIVGHPRDGTQDVEGAMRFAHSLGVRVMLAEFSPIPGTPDGDEAAKLVDLSEPLNHNKTAFAIRRLGDAEVSRLKQLSRELNARL